MKKDMKISEILKSFFINVTIGVNLQFPVQDQLFEREISKRSFSECQFLVTSNM